MEREEEGASFAPMTQGVWVRFHAFAYSASLLSIKGDLDFTAHLILNCKSESFAQEVLKVN